MKKYKIGMIGLGNWGKLLHRYFALHPGFDIVQIATRHPEAIRGIFPEVPILSTPEELLENLQIDAVIVATPLGTHFPFIMKALEKKKHVFAEKPLTLKTADAVHLARRAGAEGLVLFTDYILTFSPAIKKMISLAREGAVGALRGCCFQGRQFGAFAHDVYWDIGCHILSVLDMLIPVNQLNFTRHDILMRDGIVETGMITIRGGAQQQDFSGSLLISFNHPAKERNMTIYGDEGTLIYDLTQEKPLSLTRYKVLRHMSRNPEEKEQTYFEFDEFNTIKEVVQEFHDTLSGKRPSNIDMAVRITQVLESLAS